MDLNQDTWEWPDEFLDDVYAHSHGSEAEDAAYWKKCWQQQIADNAG